MSDRYGAAGSESMAKFYGLTDEKAARDQASKALLPDKQIKKKRRNIDIPKTQEAELIAKQSLTPQAKTPKAG